MDPKERLLDHYHHPQFCRAIKDPTARGTTQNRSCGDQITWYVNVDKDYVITEATYEASGCSFAIAGASMVASAIQGKKAQEVLSMTDEELFQLVGIHPGPVRANCLLIGLQGVHAVLKKVIST
ncbi:MAG: NifU-like protein [Microgenomates bacterium OLB22]|nr:MAG: NifU-like protein [Microgenomates bacterium OLB22]